MPVSSVERPVSALRQRMLEDMAMRAARARGLKLDIERLKTTIEELSPDLAIARGRERLAGIEALRIDAEAAIERFREFWYGKYGAWAREIAAGLELANRAQAALATFNHAAAQANACPRSSPGSS
jgi:hypothetical protein